MTDGYASLCSGIGGLDLAVESVFGYDLAWHSEFADEPASIHDRYWPDIPNLKDLTVIDWKEVRNLTVPAIRKDAQAQAMYDRYCQGLSVSQVAAEFGTSRQTVWKMFERRGYDMRSRPSARPHVDYGGRRFSLRDNGYYAATDGDRALLHRVVWEAHHGRRLPDGWDVHHVDHDKTNNDPANLQAMSKADHTRLHGGEVVPSDSPAIDLICAGYP